MTNTPTARLSESGVSIWLDDLSRKLITSGELHALIEKRNIVGVTTNPTIFASAIGNGTEYAPAIADCATRGLSASEAIIELSCEDVALACDALADVCERTHGQDGRVSIEVSPELADDVEGTVSQAQALWERVNRPNVMIKIPATDAGLAAITQVIGLGMSVNATLIFGLPRYRQVVNAYFAGLELARTAGHDLSSIHSVASVFVSRFDAAVDPQIDAMDASEASELRGKAGLANARLAAEIAEEGHRSERAKMLMAAGANPQRTLWASTGVKDPQLPDTLYITELAIPGTVNTMPHAALEAFADHGEITPVDLQAMYREADQIWNAIDGLGIDYSAIVERLEREGLEKFSASWAELLDRVGAALDAARQ